MKKLDGENLLILSVFLFVAILFVSMKVNANVTKIPMKEQIKELFESDVFFNENKVDENQEIYPEDFENEKIEKALYESGYFRSDVPLDADTQALLRAACEENNIQYELALAVIWKETVFQNVIGDGGDSVGYMQIQEKWHKNRMKSLFAYDLSNPADNFRVGCNYLSELLSKYTLEDALTAYNSGSPGSSAYARDVIAKKEQLENGNIEIN